MPRFLFTFALLVPFGAAEAATGNDVLRWCETELKKFETGIPASDLTEAAYCTGLVIGIDGYQQQIIYDLGFDERKAPESLPWNCRVGGVTHEQVVRVIVKGLKQSPEKLHNEGVPLVVKILNSAFPC